ncbi:hypothetical protein TNCV_1103361 [Trichonephila clavipes]|nr:hypothetical protein TNCV_1103361 [Trichonephila clavipes]
MTTIVDERLNDWKQVKVYSTTVAATMDVSKSVISRLNKAVEGGNALRKHTGSRDRNTTSLDDRYVALVTKRNFTPEEIAASLATATNTHFQQESSHGN